MHLLHLPPLLSLKAFRATAALLWAIPLSLAGCTSTSVSTGPVITGPAITAYQLTDTPLLVGESNSRVRHLVLHYTDDDLAGSLKSLTGPDVSAHYLLSGPQPPTDLPRVYKLVPESRRAWHAGVSHWGGRDNLNDTSIGIEIVNAGPLPLAPASTSESEFETASAAVARRWSPSREFAAWDDKQITALVALITPILTRHDIAPVDVIGHSDIAPDRKTDPGPRFPWKRLHEAGIGAWPLSEDVTCFQRQLAHDGLPENDTLLTALTVYGYPVEPERSWLAIAAFQAHFRPGAITGAFDAESAAILLSLVARYRHTTACSLD